MSNISAASSATQRTEIGDGDGEDCVGVHALADADAQQHHVALRAAVHHRLSSALNGHLWGGEWWRSETARKCVCACRHSM